MSRESIYQHLQGSLEKQIATLQSWVRQPTVSPEAREADGLAYAELLVERYSAMGCKEAKVVKTGDPWPGVYAYYDAGAKLTIASYAYFDTYGVREADWTHPPFGGVVTAVGGHKRAMIGRGANTKIPLAIWINALEAIAIAGGGLPVNVLFLNEGAEMVGSPNFEQIARAAGTRLDRVDAFMSPRSAEQAGSRDVAMTLGYKNMVTFLLECRPNTWDRGPQGGTLFGNAKSVIDSPTHRVIMAVASLIGEDGNSIAVDGLTHLNKERKSLSAEEQTLLNGIANERGDRPWAGFLPTTAGVKRFIGGLDGPELLRECLYGPSINVNEFHTSELNLPVKLTMLTPDGARAGVEFRMVTEIGAKEIVACVRKHLDARGFTDVHLTPYSVWDGHQSRLGSPVVRAVVETLEKYGRRPVIWPMQPFGGPWAHYPRKLGVDAINGGGLGHGGRGGAAADEYFVLESDGSVAGLVEAERYCVDLVLRFAELAGR